MMRDDMNVEQGFSLCRLRTGEDIFGIETFTVCEMLRQCELCAVPLAPKFIAGVLAYRGEVLVAVSFRALLGMEPDVEAPCAVVLRDGESGEKFALLVDDLLDVVQVSGSAWEPNPAMLDERRSSLFSGAYRTAGAPLIRLAPEHMQPSWLMQNFEREMTGEHR
jgi:purine-binding chemotaxis protein CheW